MSYLQSLAASLTFFLVAACAHSPETTTIPDSSPPDTDIYLARLNAGKAPLSISGIKPLVNYKGYDNQPAFLPDEDALLYVSAGASGKTDLWRIDLVTGQSEQITSSPERSEYSPRLMPGVEAISFIQENPAGDITELYARKYAGGAEEAIIALKPLGYYTLLQGGKIVLSFLRDEPPSLQRTEQATGLTREIARNIGRALQTAPDGQSAFFTLAGEDGTHTLQRYDETRQSVDELFKLKGNAQDYAVFELPGSKATGFLCTSNGRLYFRTDRADDGWQEIADLAALGLNNVSRLAVNKRATRLALVTDR